LFSNLRKPSNVVEAPALACNVGVDARNLTILFSVEKYPPPVYDLLSNSLDAFSYEGIVLALKNWQNIITFAPLGIISDPSIPGNIYHCGYTAIAYRVAEAVVDCYTTGKLAELTDLHNQLTVYATRDVSDKTPYVKTPYVIPNFIIRLLRRIPLNTVWLNSHQEGRNCLT